MQGCGGPWAAATPQLWWLHALQRHTWAAAASRDHVGSAASRDPRTVWDPASPWLAPMGFTTPPSARRSPRPPSRVPDQGHTRSMGCESGLPHKMCFTRAWCNQFLHGKTSYSALACALLRVHGKPSIPDGQTFATNIPRRIGSSGMTSCLRSALLVGGGFRAGPTPAQAS